MKEEQLIIIVFNAKYVCTVCFYLHDASHKVVKIIGNLYIAVTYEIRSSYQNTDTLTPHTAYFKRPSFHDKSLKPKFFLQILSF